MKGINILSPFFHPQRVKELKGRKSFNYIEINHSLSILSPFHPSPPSRVFVCVREGVKDRKNRDISPISILQKELQDFIHFLNPIHSPNCMASFIFFIKKTLAGNIASVMKVCLPGHGRDSWPIFLPQYCKEALR
ncbi:MAG: hypothetical protein AB7F75_13075 [Planctomycetota bacterium]